MAGLVLLIQLSILASCLSFSQGWVGLTAVTSHHGTMCLTLGALQQQGECTSPVCPCSVALRIRWSVLFLPAVTSSAMWPNSRASCCPKQLPASLPVCGPQGAFRAALCSVAKPSCLMLLPAAWASRKHSKGLGVKVGDFFLHFSFVSSAGTAVSAASVWVLYGTALSW